jgi:hypothetical protein
VPSRTTAPNGSTANIPEISIALSLEDEPGPIATKLNQVLN